MKSLFPLLIYFFSTLISFPVMAQKPVHVIFDTDMGNDIDDALALAMIHALESRGEAKLLAVTLTKDNKFAAPYVDVVNTFYGRGNIPIGVVKNGITKEDSKMIQVPVEAKKADGSSLFPHDLKDGTQAPEAVGLLRQVLSQEEDGSVVIIQVGFSTNLARLLDSSPDDHSSLNGKELVKRKVRLLSIMAGEFPSGPPEYNVREDIASAKKVFYEWPTLVVASGYEIGKSILYPAYSIENHFKYVENHPVVLAYKNYQEMPYDRPTWDLTSVLFAIRPDEGYLGFSEKGKIMVDEQGKTSLQPEITGNHHYLTVNEIQRKQVLEALMLLSSQPPGSMSNDQ
ncbi:nucleoside hydrolase [soil metagenome]